jgi:hypothetical protein
VRYHSEPIRIEDASLAIVGAMVPDRLREVLAGADDPRRVEARWWPGQGCQKPLPESWRRSSAATR